MLPRSTCLLLAALSLAPRSASAEDDPPIFDDPPSDEMEAARGVVETGPRIRTELPHKFYVFVHGDLVGMAICRLRKKETEEAGSTPGQPKLPGSPYTAAECTYAGAFGTLFGAGNGAWFMTKACARTGDEALLAACAAIGGGYGGAAWLKWATEGCKGPQPKPMDVQLKEFWRGYFRDYDFTFPGGWGPWQQGALPNQEDLPGADFPGNAPGAEPAEPGGTPETPEFDAPEVAAFILPRCTLE